MIVTKTPLRVSLFGGGSDIEEFYLKEPGAVLSFTIDKFIYITMQDVASKHIKLMYSEVEQVNQVSELKHELVKACLHRYRRSIGLEIASFADIPTKGTGLGSSSSFTVGLIKALCVDQNKVPIDNQTSRYALADEACEIEIQDCGKRIGKQDQYAAAMGGMNLIEFAPYGEFVSPIDPRGLIEHLTLIYTGITRSADVVLANQVESLRTNDPRVHKITCKMRDMAYKAVRLLQDHRYDDIGMLLHDAWELKREISSEVTNKDIDQLYWDILNAGALGGKLLGAGGGGYILAYTPFVRGSDHYVDFCNKFRDRILPFSISYGGSSVLFSDKKWRTHEV